MISSDMLILTGQQSADSHHERALQLSDAAPRCGGSGSGFSGLWPRAASWVPTARACFGLCSDPASKHNNYVSGNPSCLVVHKSWEPQRTPADPCSCVRAYKLVASSCIKAAEALEHPPTVGAFKGWVLAWSACCWLPSFPCLSGSGQPWAMETISVLAASYYHESS